MFDDMIFRLVFAVLAILLYMNHHVLHRRPPSKTKAVQASRLETWLIWFLFIWTGTLVLYVTGIGLSYYQLPLPLGARWIGAGLMLLCVPMSQWIYYTLGVHFSKKLELRSDHQLVKEGPYRYVRHPMYTTLFVCALATCLVTASALTLASAVVVAALMLARIKKEEAMLISRFGDSYLAYMRGTGALLPRLRMT